VLESDGDADVAPHLSPVRRLLGLLSAALAAIVSVGTVAGVWNPWRFVRLQQFFGDPFLGLLLLNILTLSAFWLLAPVRSEAADGRRQAVRWLLGLALVPVLSFYGVFHQFFDVTTVEIARSPSGERRAAFVTHGDERQVRIWSGNWLTLRDIGLAGTPCGLSVRARFTSEDQVHITSVYGEYDVRLDHRTARPLNHGPATCSG
jgi:hypothetical protein